MLLPSVAWRMDGNIIAAYSTSTSQQTNSNVSKYNLDINPFSSTYGHLTVLNTILADAGVYVCVASTTGGSQSSSTQLQVQGIRECCHSEMLTSCKRFCYLTCLKKVEHVCFPCVCPIYVAIFALYRDQISISLQEC